MVTNAFISLLNSLKWKYKWITFGYSFVALLDFFSITLLFLSVQSIVNENSRNYLNEKLNEYFQINSETQIYIAITLFFLRIIYSYYINKKIIKDSQLIQNEIRLRLTESVFYGNLKEKIFDIQDVMYRQTMQVGNVVYQSFFIVFGNLICILTFATFCLLFKPYESLLVILFILLFLIIFKGIAKKLVSKGESTNKAYGRLISELDTILRNSIDITSYESTDYFKNRLFNRSQECAINNIFSFTTSIRIKYSFEFIFALIVTGSILSLYIFQYNKVLIVGILTSLFVSYRIIPSIYSLLSNIYRIYYNQDSVVKIAELLYFDKTQKKLEHSKKRINVTELCVKNLNIYINNIQLKHINNLSFELKEGNKLAIVGKSGVGKTKMLQVLCGHHKEYKGDVYWLSNNNKYLPVNMIGSICYVSQVPFLFSGTILENITLGHEFDMKHLLNTTHRVLGDANFNVLSTDDLLNYRINDGGSNLSGGQKYRICIARAIFFGLKVIFFDEPTAALDESSKTDFIKLLNNSLQDQIIIIVTHDETVANSCDKKIIIR